jgi:hypothetical protein
MSDSPRYKIISLLPCSPEALIVRATLIETVCQPPLSIFARYGRGSGVRCVLLSELPVELRQLSPDQIEDLLCIFKDRLHINGTVRPRRLHSRC